jgi:hypothetical protein
VVVGVGVNAGLPVPVTVNVYVPAVVPGVIVPPPPPPPPPPQPEILPSATITTSIPISDGQFLLLDGIPRNTRNARIAPSPAPASPELPPWPCREIAVAGAVVPTVTVAVPVVAVPLSVTVELPLEQEGKCVAPAGLVVNAQLIVTVPA